MTLLEWMSRWWRTTTPVPERRTAVVPEPARTERNWWTAAASRIGWHSDAWTMAKRTATPNLSARTVAFERLS